MNWIKVNNEDESTLPPLDKTVAVIHLSGYDGMEMFTIGGRVDDGDGWMWAIANDARGYRRYDNDHELVIEDDYRVTHWAEIEWPED